MLFEKIEDVSWRDGDVVMKCWQQPPADPTT